MVDKVAALGGAVNCGEVGHGPTIIDQHDARHVEDSTISL